ncbi:MAG: hypothetical protein J6V44_03725 [Methanobrevibacter sp.]|nr:hypothetical protein [Methanobrevibacter sp.]
MTDTGWKTPLTINQDSSRKVNNDHACYDFADLKDVLKDDFHYAYIPVSGGIDSLRASPVVYAYNYNFNIPLTAKINKVYVLPVFQQGNGANYGNVVKLKTLTLKTTSSLTDYGGEKVKNLANDNFIKNIKVPIGEWTTESTFKEGSRYVFGDGDNPWGIELTPSLINSTNFGCIFQVVGTEYKKWVMPRLAKLLMKVVYDSPSSSSDESKLIPSKETLKYYVNNSNNEVQWDSFYTSKTTFSGLDVAKQDTGMKVKVERTHIGKSTSSAVTTISSNNLLIGSDKLKSYSLPSLKYGGDEKEKSYGSHEFKVYPGFVGGTQILEVSTESSNQGGAGFTRYIKFFVEGDTFTDNSGEPVEHLVNENQYCKITRCTFKKNDATYTDKTTTPPTPIGTGGAMYITTEHFKYSGNIYGEKDTPDANTCGATDGVPNLCYNDKKIE